MSTAVRDSHVCRKRNGRDAAACDASARGESAAHYLVVSSHPPTRSVRIGQLGITAGLAFRRGIVTRTGRRRLPWRGSVLFGRSRWTA